MSLINNISEHHWHDVRTNLLPTYHEPRSGARVQARFGSTKAIEFPIESIKLRKSLPPFPRASKSACRVLLRHFAGQARHRSLVGDAEEGVSG